MTKQLSSAFFGAKKLTREIYQFQIISNNRFDSQLIGQMFRPYTEKLKAIKSTDNQISLSEFFQEFIMIVYNKFQKWNFQKLSSIIQISAHVFQHSFQNWLTKAQSFKYFSEVVVRHSLFRPPHSVCIFQYEQMKQITQFWIQNFNRYYQQYQECFQSDLNEIIISNTLPTAQSHQNSLKGAKIIQKSSIEGMLNNLSV